MEERKWGGFTNEESADFGRYFGVERMQPILIVWFPKEKMPCHNDGIIEKINEVLEKTKPRGVCFPSAMEVPEGMSWKDVHGIRNLHIEFDSQDIEKELLLMDRNVIVQSVETAIPSDYSVESFSWSDHPFQYINSETAKEILRICEVFAARIDGDKESEIRNLSVIDPPPSERIMGGPPLRERMLKKVPFFVNMRLSGIHKENPNIDFRLDLWVFPDKTCRLLCYSLNIYSNIFGIDQLYESLVLFTKKAMGAQNEQ